MPSKMREKDMERRIENNAAIFDECQPYFKQVAWSASPDKRAAFAIEPPQVAFKNRFSLKIFALRLQCVRRVGPELLSEADHLSPDHLEELGRTSPKALARLAMAYRDQYKRAA